MEPDLRSDVQRDTALHQTRAFMRRHARHTTAPFPHLYRVRQDTTGTPPWPQPPHPARHPLPHHLRRSLISFSTRQQINPSTPSHSTTFCAKSTASASIQTAKHVLSSSKAIARWETPVRTNMQFPAASTSMLRRSSEPCPPSLPAEDSFIAATRRPPKRSANLCIFSCYSLVCKHWLRSLCKKGEACEFLHEYNLRKMPECNFYVRYGYCSNNEECLYLHIHPDSKIPVCPHYENGFCPLGPVCSKKHVRTQQLVCKFYLAGFCPVGRKDCKEGAHPRWTDPKTMQPPTVKKPREEPERDPMFEERERERERERFGGGGRGGRGGFGGRRFFDRGPGGGAGRRDR